MFQEEKLARKITVPFCPESALSGIGNKDFMPAVWYLRTFELSQEQRKGRIMLHFGAVDYERRVWINSIIALHSVSLDCDEQEPEKMEGTFSFFKRLYDNQQKWDEEFRAYAAEELAGAAVEWQGDSEEGREPVTKESFAKRIRISAISMKSDGEYTVCFEDDDMFYGHTIEIEGSVEKGMEGADIVG